MEKQIIKGRFFLKRIIAAIYFTLFALYAYNISIPLFCTMLLFSVIFLLASFPKKIIIEDDGFYMKTLFIGKKVDINWDDIITVKYSEESDWDTLFKLLLNIILCGWIPLERFRSTYELLEITDTEHKTFRVRNYSFKDYDILFNILEKRGLVKRSKIIHFNDFTNKF